MTTAKKIGLIAFILVEIIICISAIIVFYKVGKDTAKVDDLAMIIYAQTGVLGIVWGGQAAVNYAKNRRREE
jgi:hypothetical protein